MGETRIPCKGARGDHRLRGRVVAGQHPARLRRHPLDPLTEIEIAGSVQVLREAGKFDEASRPPDSSGCRRPAKAFVLWPGSPATRSRAVSFSGREAGAGAHVRGGRGPRPAGCCSSSDEVPGAQPPISWRRSSASGTAWRWRTAPFQAPRSRRVVHPPTSTACRRPALRGLLSRCPRKEGRRLLRRDVLPVSRAPTTTVRPPDREPQRGCVVEAEQSGASCRSWTAALSRCRPARAAAIRRPTRGAPCPVRSSSPSPAATTSS